jgi:flavin-dependent dehydrogenase
MQHCDVLIVGGGPAGSSCAWMLRRAGLDVVVLDRAVFPRDKVCAGWITPPVVAALHLDLDDYRRGRTLQPITGFRTGVIGSPTHTDTVYDTPVSFGIRRCEFDDYLLRRSGARLTLGAGLQSVRRDGAAWLVNDSIRTAMLVGAGGHFCPVAHLLNPAVPAIPVVVAQEAEFPIADGDADWRVAPHTPELYFCRDLKGYGWCFRKDRYLNVGLGRLDRRSLPKAATEFVAFLQRTGRIPGGVSWRWQGHAYAVSAAAHRRAVDAGVLLVGDAAGIAYPESGEGIRPAIESGLLAAAAIVDANGDYTRERLERYDVQLQKRFGVGPEPRLIAQALPQSLTSTLLPWLLGVPWFVRRVLIDRWFLHLHQPALVTSS